MSFPATVLITLVLALFTRPAQETAPEAAAPSLEREGAPYLLEVCAVRGAALPKDGGKVFIHDGTGDQNQKGREFRVCCERCLVAIRKEPAKYVAKVDELMIADQIGRYPATATCIVMPEEALPDPTGPEARDCKMVVHKNRLVRLCCGKCVRMFKRDPAKYLAVLDAAVIAEAKSSGRIKTCPMTDRALPGHAAWFVIGDQAVGTCCGGCRRRAEADPRTTVAKVRAAMAK